MLLIQPLIKARARVSARVYQGARVHASTAGEQHSLSCNLYGCSGGSLLYDFTRTLGDFRLEHRAAKVFKMLL